MPMQAKLLLQFCIKNRNYRTQNGLLGVGALLFVVYIFLHSTVAYADGLKDKPANAEEAVSDLPPPKPEVSSPVYNRANMLPKFEGKPDSHERVYKPSDRPWQQQQGIANRDDSLPPEATAASLNLKTIGPVGQIELLGSGFYYPADFTARYLRAKSNWREAHDGEPVALDTMHILALQALDPKPDTLKLLETWRIQGGPAPWLFYPVVLVHNASQTEAVLNVRLKMKLEFQFGQYFVDPNTLLVDYEHLQNSAQWEPVLEKERWLHSLAPQEDAQVVLNPVDLLQAMENRRNQWPYAIRLTVTLLPSGQLNQSCVLTLTPDHFALPLTFY